MKHHERPVGTGQDTLPEWTMIDGPRKHQSGTKSFKKNEVNAEGEMILRVDSNRGEKCLFEDVNVACLHRHDKLKMLMMNYICLRTKSLPADEHWNCQTNGSPASRVVIDSLMPFSASKPSPFSALCKSENSVLIFSPSKLSSMCSRSFLSGASTFGLKL